MTEAPQASRLVPHDPDRPGRFEAERERIARALGDLREWPHTHHIHVVEAGGDEERRTLAFRDYLRDHPDARREYEELKWQCARQFGETTAEEREEYAEAKGEFIGTVIEKAFEGGIRGVCDRAAGDQTLCTLGAVRAVHRMYRHAVGCVARGSRHFLRQLAAKQDS